MPDEQSPNRVVRMTPDEAFAVMETCVEVAMEAPSSRFTRDDKVRMSLAFEMVRDYASLGVQVAGNMAKAEKAKNNAKPGPKGPVIKGDGNTDPKDLHAQLTKAADAADKTPAETGE